MNNQEFEEKNNTHLVVEYDDLKFATYDDEEVFWEIFERATHHLEKQKSYYVVNRDEPYADIIADEIKRGEGRKNCTVQICTVCSKCTFPVPVEEDECPVCKTSVGSINE